jgi:hypothetical protein
MQRVAVAAYDVFGCRHLDLKFGIVGRQLVAAVRRFDQIQGFSVGRVQPTDDLFGQNDAKRVTKFADLEFDQDRPSCKLLLL